MGTPIGNLGGIAVVPETVYGTTPATPAWVWQHPVSATLGNRREVITPVLLSYSAQACQAYSGIYSDGDIVVGLELEEDIIGPILGLAGHGAAGLFKLGDGSVPDVPSISALLSYGGGGADPTNNLEYIFPGEKATALRFEIVADSNSTLTAVLIGQPGVKTAAGSAIAPAPPGECGVFMPSDVGIVIIGVGETWETEVCLHSATVEVATPKTGFERRCLGGNMKEPITNARPGVTFSLALDLDDTTGNNTIGLLEAFNAGHAIGDIKIGDDFLLKDAFMGGDFPSLAAGLIDFTLSGSASEFDVTTVAHTP